jgi:hypothetical protein
MIGGCQTALANTVVLLGDFGAALAHFKQRPILAWAVLSRVDFISHSGHLYLVMHQDEGWRSPQPASRGKVVSTKVGCGRFTANVTERCWIAAEADAGMRRPRTAATRMARAGNGAIRSTEILTGGAVDLAARRTARWHRAKPGFEVEPQPLSSSAEISGSRWRI